MGILNALSWEYFCVKFYFLKKKHNLIQMFQNGLIDVLTLKRS